MKKISKRDASAGRKLLAEERAAAPASVYPEKPWIRYDRPTANGLKTIYAMACENVPEKTVSVLLGDPNLFGKKSDQPNAARIAFNEGEAEGTRMLMAEIHWRVHTLHDSNALYFSARIKGYRESGPTVEVKNTSVFQFLPPDMSTDDAQRNMAAAADEGILLLPKPMTEAEYTKINGPTIDSRMTKNIVAAMVAIFKPDTEIDAYLQSIGRDRMRPEECGTMIDVSPERPAQLAPPTPTPARSSIGPGYSTSDPTRTLQQ